MFFGTSTLSGIGNLINQNAIGLLRANTYAAARQFLGAGKEDLLNKVVDAYTKFVIPRTNRALATPEIINDYNFKRIANAIKAGPKDSGKGKALDISPGNFGLSDSLVFGLPNWLLYGGLGYAGYRYYKKKKGGKGFSLFGKRKSTRRKSRRTSRRVSFAGTPPVIGGGA